MCFAIFIISTGQVGFCIFDQNKFDLAKFVQYFLTKLPIYSLNITKKFKLRMKTFLQNYQLCTTTANCEEN